MKSKRIQIRNFLIILVPLALMFFGVFGFCSYVGYTRIPPKEAKLLQNFSEHRAAFEQLRDMLLVDTNLSRVGRWGVSLRKPHFVGYPNEQQFPKDRLEKYQALFKEVGAKLASRNESEKVDPEPCVYLWTWGNAVSPRHYNIGICWLNHEPTNQISTLDGYHGHSEDANAYRHIDSNWYFWTDL